MTDYRNRITGLEYVASKDLTPHPGNWREHGKAQTDALKGVLSEVGIAGALLAYRSERNGGKLTVIDGHLRKDAAPQTWPVLVLDVSDAEADYLLATHDPLAAMATADAAALDALLATVNSGDQAVQEMLAGLAKEAGLYGEPKGDDPGAQIDKAEELRHKLGTESGQLWQLGEHRVIVGDCTDAAVVGRVMGEGKINMAFTSPPYAMQRQEAYGGINPGLYVEWWEMVQEPVNVMLSNDGSFFVNIKPHAEELDRNLYVFDLVLAMCRKWGWHFAEEFCWERAGIPQRVTRRFKNQFEPIYQFVRGEWKFRPDSVRHESDRVPVAIGKGAGDTNAARRQGKMSAIQGNKIGDGMAYPGNRLPTFQDVTQLFPHPATFPIGLPSFFLRAFTDENDLVYDPFLGSGTTLIACERLGRRCRGVEISPAYVAVTLERWATMTGKTPELLP